MKKIFALCLCLVGLSQFAFAEDSKPEVYVVKLHADWCGTCLVLGPVIDKARGMAGLDDTGALFVTLDLTDATTRNQSALMASALGLREFYDKNAGKTGYAILVNAESGKIEGTLTKDMDANAMVSKIQAFL